MSNFSEDDVEKVAEHAHEANRCYCESISDFSQVAWAEAPEEIKESARTGVRFLVERPRTTPEQTHDAWCAYKLAGGWGYGKIKSEEAKTHPCLVAYSDLPEKQKIKDYLFANLVKSAIIIVENSRGN